MGYCFTCKPEFENSWPDLLAAKISGLAKVERIEQSTYCVNYGSKSIELTDLSVFLNDCGLVCVTYDSGFFILFGWRRTSVNYGDCLLIRLEHQKTTNKRKHKAVLARITNILNELAVDDQNPSPKPENPPQQ